MANLQDIINLAKADGGKFFVIDEKGDVKLVIMNIEDYQRMLLGKLQKQILDVENINQEIIRAQMLEQEEGEEVRPPKKSEFLGPTVKQVSPKVDLRAEVIDPSFDFEGPKLEIDDF